jgi:hypothetical protein
MKLYVGFHWGYHFKWGVDNENCWESYSEKARALLCLMDSYIIMNDGLDDVEEGTVLFVKCFADEIDGIIEILNENGFGDWAYYSYNNDRENDVVCINGLTLSD